MIELGTQDILRIGEETSFFERKASIEETMLTSPIIQGCALSGQLSALIVEVIQRVLDEMDLPKDGTIGTTGSLARKQLSPLSDLDIQGFIPQEDEYFLGEFSRIYIATIRRLLTVLRMEGNPVIMVPGLIKTDPKDLIKVATMSLDMIALLECHTVTIGKVKEKILGVHGVCPPIRVTTNLETLAEQMRSQRIYTVQFNVKKDRGGLQHLQYALWLLTVLEKIGAPELQIKLQKEHPEVYDALNLLLHIRSWLHLKKGQRHGERVDKMTVDILTSDFWNDLKELFGKDIIVQIQNARTVINNFVQTCILEKKNEGIPVGGVTYSETGLKIDMENVSEDSIIRLLKVAQETGIRISPLQFNFLRSNARNYISESLINPAWGELLRAEGNFSNTVEILKLFRIVDHIFPNFNVLLDAEYTLDPRVENVLKAGRVVDRLVNLEQQVAGDSLLLGPLYNGLDGDEKAGIRLALSCIDIPAPNRTGKECGEEKTQLMILFGQYFEGLISRFPGLLGASRLTLYLLEKHRILFECALRDDWNNPTELDRIAKEVGSLKNLRALLVYTCAILDYGREGQYLDYQWAEVFNLYDALAEKFEGYGPGTTRYRRLQKMEEYLKPEELDMYKKAPGTFLYSRYVLRPEHLKKTIKSLVTVQETGEEQITPIWGERNEIQLFVSAKDSINLQAIIAGVCTQNGISILNLEKYTFQDGQETAPQAEYAHTQTGDPLAVVFIKACFTDSQLSPRQREERGDKVKTGLSGAIKTDTINENHAGDILRDAKLKFTLEKTNTGGNYKLMITAEKDKRGFFRAITELIALSGVKNSLIRVYTHPGNDENQPIVEDIFILGPENIDVLKRKLEEYSRN